MGGEQVGWGGGREMGDGCPFNGGDFGKISVGTFSNPFLKILTEGLVSTEVRSLFQYFTNLTENDYPLLRRWLAPWSTLKGCPLRPRRAGWRKLVCINIQKAREYLEGGNQVSSKSSPLQGMKAQPLQSLFVGEVTNASYQPCS